MTAFDAFTRGVATGLLIIIATLLGLLDYYVQGIARDVHKRVRVEACSWGASSVTATRGADGTVRVSRPSASGCAKP